MYRCLFRSAGTHMLRDMLRDMPVHRNRPSEGVFPHTHTRVPLSLALPPPLLRWSFGGRWGRGAPSLRSLYTVAQALCWNR